MSKLVFEILLHDQSTLHSSQLRPAIVDYFWKDGDLVLFSEKKVVVIPGAAIASFTAVSEEPLDRQKVLEHFI